MSQRSSSILPTFRCGLLEHLSTLLQELHLPVAGKLCCLHRMGKSYWGVGKQLPNAKRPNEITSQYCNWLTLEHCTCDTSCAVLNFLSLKTLQLSSRQNPDNSFAMLISCRPCRRPLAAAALQLWHGALAAAQSQEPSQTGKGG